MSTISIIGSGGMAAAIGGLAAKAGHTVEAQRKQGEVLERPRHGQLPGISAWRWRRVRLANIGTGLRARASGSARSPRPMAAVWACRP
jgi:hypothetical protein